MSDRIMPSADIPHRDDFALHCNVRKLFRAVEIGVDRGEFAQTFLNRWGGHEYFGVDPYEPLSGFPYGRQGDLLVAAIRFERHASRARLVISSSAETAANFEKLQDRGSPTTDFVYLDGDHAYDGVSADIRAWWPRISDGGILAGHDFDETHPGVQQAVREFAERENVTVFVTSEPECASWYAYKGSSR